MLKDGSEDVEFGLQLTEGVRASGLFKANIGGDLGRRRELREGVAVVFVFPAFAEGWYLQVFLLQFLLCW